MNKRITIFKKYTKLLVAIVLALPLFNACSKDDDQVDEVKPTITTIYSNGFPQPCAVLQRGETYSLRAMASDNVGLASYSIDLHNNFDHHTHDNHDVECVLDPLKSPVNPFIYIENGTIGNQQSYEIIHEITIPDDIDVGDYHFQMSVTDVTGWQSRTFVDIKIVE